MHRAHGTVVAGIHRLQHVERRFVADLADDDPVGAHPQGVADEVADAYLAASLDVRWPRLESEHMFLVQLQLGRVLDGDDPLVTGDEGRQDVERRRLAGPSAAGHENVEATGDAGVQEVRHRPSNGPECHQVVGDEGISRELPDCQSEPSTARGGMMALTRLPSGRRASHIGLDSSTRRPTRPTILSIVRRRWPSSVNRPTTG